MRCIPDFPPRVPLLHPSSLPGLETIGRNGWNHEVFEPIEPELMDGESNWIFPLMDGDHDA